MSEKTSEREHRLADLKEAIAHHLHEIAQLFKHPKITLVVRAPDLPDGDVVMTDDEPGEAIAAIERLYPEVAAESSLRARGEVDEEERADSNDALLEAASRVEASYRSGALFVDEDEGGQTIDWVSLAATARMDLSATARPTPSEAPRPMTVAEALRAGEPFRFVRHDGQRVTMKIVDGVWMSACESGLWHGWIVPLAIALDDINAPATLVPASEAP